MIETPPYVRSRKQQWEKPKAETGRLCNPPNTVTQKRFSKSAPVAGPGNMFPHYMGAEQD
jgi:hypothetical protein